MARSTSSASSARPTSAGASSRSRAGKRRRTAEPSDVLRAEYGAQQEGRQALAANYAQLRKVLCLDARTMEDASASGTEDDGRPRAA